MKLLFLIVVGVGLANASACIEVERDHVLAGDLAGAVPLLQAIDAATQVGFAPAPGLQRVFSAREVASFARDHGVAIEPGTVFPSVCVVREARPVSPDVLQAAFQASLGVEGAAIEILEYSLQPAPPGTLEFPLAGLNHPPAGAPESPVIWRGRLVYDGQHSVSLWAKVRIRIPEAWPVARDAVPSGSIVRVDQVREVALRPFPLPVGAAVSKADVVGKIARRNIPAGQPFFRSALEERRDVNRGDRIQVKVTDGRATLSFQGEAETSGTAGDTVLVRNPTSGRSFRALVEGEGLVSVHCVPGESQ